MGIIEERQEFKRKVNEALSSTALWGFSLQEQASALGFDAPVGQNPSYLQSQLNQEKGIDTAERVELIIEAGARVDKLIDAGNIGLKVRWLETRLASLGKSPKMAMLEDGLEGLRRFVEVLRNCT